MLTARRTARTGSSAAGRRDWRRVASAVLDAERGRLIIWVPVLLGIGIVVFFGLRADPAPWIGPAGTLAGAGFALFGAVQLQSRPMASLLVRLTGTCAALIALGFSLAALRTHLVAQPILPRAVGPVDVIGTVLAREDRADGQRFLLRVDRIGALTAAQTPHRVRISWRGPAAPLRPGDLAMIRARLSPPPAPVIPGGYDYGRQLYFERIGGLGIAVAAPERLRPSARPAKTAGIERLRDSISDRVRQVLPSPEGPLIAALVNGKRDGIPEEVTEQLRDTGLAHLVAISGFNMAIVCGFVFFAVRGGLGLNAAWIARYPLKKWAAIAGLIAATFYLSISGAAWSAVRAYIMAVIGFGAILVDREAISLRNVAIAATAIIGVRPESVVSAGFQMSFAAVLALVAVYAAWQRMHVPMARGLGFRAGAFLIGTAVTSLVAGLATGPFSVFHFGRVATFGLIANLVVMPLSSLYIMPLCVLGLVLMPFGLDGFVWHAAAAGIRILLQVAQEIAAWEGAVVLVPQWPRVAFLALVLALIILCAAGSALRFVGLLLVPLGLALAVNAPQPIGFVAEDARNIGIVAARASPADLRILSSRREAFTVRAWQETLGLPPLARRADLPVCGTEECALVDLESARLAIAADIAGTAHACRQAEVVIAQIWDAHALPQTCKARLITSATVAASGPLTIWALPDGQLRIDAVQAIRGDRPWSRPASADQARAANTM